MTAAGLTPTAAGAIVYRRLTIVAELPLAQSTVSQHLKILKESGMVQGEIDGPKVCYCINPEKLAALKELIAAL